MSGEVESPRHRIARRVAAEIPDGAWVNLGVGLPSLVARYLPAGREVLVHCENGVLGTTAEIPYADRDPMVVNATNQYVHLAPGASLFGSDLSFGIMRGHHLDLTVLGAMQVDSSGSLANWQVKDGPMVGMGGAMDLVAGARRVIVATQHTDRDGRPKIRTRCDYPLTGRHVVDVVVTELAVIDVTPDGLVLRELSPDTSIEEVLSRTEARLLVPEHLRTAEETVCPVLPLVGEAG